MKKMIMLVSMLMAIQAQAVTIVVPPVRAVYVTPHVSMRPVSTSSHVTNSQAKATNSASKMNNSAKTLTHNVIEPNKVIEAKGSKEVVKATNVSVGSLNSSAKSFGCEAPKVEKKVEPPKCDK